MNNWSVWEQMALGVKRGISSPGKTLFTNKFVEVNDTSVCMKGWNNEGMKEFNEILNYLVSIRNDIHMINMETELMMEYERFDVVTPKKQKRNCNNDVLLEERVVPFDGYTLNFEQV